MLTIEINNKELLTDDNFSCRISVKNPFTRFNELQGPLAADISIPAKGNLGDLNFPTRVTKQSAQNDRKFTGGLLRHNGIALIAGDMVITDAQEKIACWIQNYLGKLGEELREKTLQELTILADQTFTNKTTFDPDSDFWCTIRLMNKGFWKDRGQMTQYTAIEKDLAGNDVEKPNTEIELLSKKFMDEASWFVNQNGTGGVKTSAGTDGVVAVSPFPFLHHLIDQILRQNKFYISDNFLKLDADLKTLCLYTNSTIVKDTPLTTATNFNIYNFFTNLNETVDLEKLDSATWAPDVFSISDLMPNSKLKEIILGTQNFANVIFWFDNNRNVRIIDRESILTGPSFDLSKYRITDWIPGTRKDVTLKFSWDHDSNDSAFSEVFENLDDKRHKILDAVATRNDLDALLLPKAVGDIRLVEAEGIYYEYKWHTLATADNAKSESEADVLGWKEASIDLQNYFFNDGDKTVEEIKSCFSTLRMSADGHPVTYQRGNSKTFSSISEEFSPRLMFYKGNNTGGDESTSGKKFNWQGTNGFIQNRWKFTAPFLANALPMRAKFRFPSNILSYVANTIYQKYNDDECEFIIDELIGDPGQSDETVVEISVYKVEDSFWQFNPGTVPGGGDGTDITFTPKFVGVNEYGKPYLIDETGNLRPTSVFGNISTANYAHNCCVDYDSTLQQLVVGGLDGFIHIYDVTNNFRLKSIQVFTGNESVSAISIINNRIFVGKNNNGYIYSIATQADIDNYITFSATAALLPSGYLARDFIYVDGFYYCCTQAGEVFKGTSHTSWVQLFDVSANFTRFAVTDTRIMVMETTDRPFWCLRSDTSAWHEFDLKSGSEPCLIDAAGNGSQAVAISNGFTQSIFMIDASLSVTPYSIGAYPVSIINTSDIFIAGKDAYTTSGRLYKYNGSSFAFQFNLPEGLKLFMY